MLKALKKEFRKLLRAFLHPHFFFLIILGNGILLVATLVVYFMEKGLNPHITRYLDSLWWGVATITTVGFGDIVPVTTAGRIIGMALMYTGTTLFVTFTGLLVTRWLSEEVERELTPLEKEILKEVREQFRIEETLQRIEDRLEQLEKK